MNKFAKLTDKQAEPIVLKGRKTRKSKEAKGRRMKVGGQLVELLTIEQLAQVCGGRKAATMRRLEQESKFPPPNFRGKSVKLANSSTRLGPRLYSRELAEKVAEVFAKYVRNGVKMPEQANQLIRDAFAAEKAKYFPS